MKGRKRVKDQQDVSAGNELTAYPLTILRSLGTKWCKDRINSQKFSAILHTQAHICTYMHTCTHKGTYTGIYTLNE